MKLSSALLIFALTGLTSCTSETSTPTAAASENVAEQPVEQVATWNTADPDVMSNGNIEVAIAAFVKGVEVSKDDIPAGKVYKRPWDFYGKNLCFTGEVILASDYPPGNPLSQQFGGDMAEVVFVTNDRTIVDAFIKGTSESAVKGQPIKICGLPAGRAEVDNQLGGKTTQLIIIGAISE